ncbi:MAG TPA: TolC family protein [Terriglobales bacterium]|nr:TolC family protein [Terriglobales bacterium]
MASADRSTCLLIVLVAVFAMALCTPLFAQGTFSGSAASAAGGTIQVPTSQVQTSGQNPVFGSVPEAKATPGTLSLTFGDAIERALRQNLAGLLSEYNTIEARGQKWQQLSDLLPNVSGDVQEVAEKESLQALGIRNGGLFGNNVPSVIGPFSYFDVRASATLRVFDWKSIQKYRSSVIGEGVAKFNLKDARDLVVLATGNAYLQAIAGAARVETAQAQVESARALYKKAVAQQQAGVAPAIDTLRAQVEYQTRQQQLIAATNDFAKQKISLARVIGLATGQEFELADKAPYEAFPVPDLETSLQRAYSLRSDYKAARDRLVAAQLEHNAAVAGYFPTIDMAVNFGEIGAVPGDVEPTYEVVGTLNIPIFQGGKVHGDVLKAEASLRQAQAQMADVRGQIDQDIRNALLDLKSSSDQVEVAQSSVNLAEQALTQSQDRFSAGVTDNLEVVQAQESVAGAHESLISSLYLHNLAKVSFARALGRAEEGVREYLKGK